MLKIWCAGTVLCDGTAAGGICESLTINGTRVVEVAQLIRAAFVTCFDRQNRHNELQLSISIQSATLIASLNAALTAGDDLPVVADLTIQLQEAGTLYTAIMTGAGWRSVAPRLIGVSNVTAYSIVGGAWSTGTADAGDIEGGADFAAYPSFAIDGGTF